MDIKRLFVIPTVLSLALASFFVFAADTENKEVMATFKTQDGKEIRCLVHPDDKGVAGGLTKGDKIELIQGILNPAATDLSNGVVLE
ncbi:hypothetical protein [Legionella nagasakiensis]|uniref:hypothetical protein n=1 Tax=Legionella nagasakiensis TaxID=535290 RepID=UPI0010559ADD|nr:hypothetical protein [Legionella nagasakiensis]